MKTYAVWMVLAALQAPARDSLMAAGVRLAGMEPAAALLRFEELLRADSADVEAGWRAAIAGVDVSLPLVAKGVASRRDSLLARAEESARRALRVAPENPDALFALGLVLGNRALGSGIRTRIKLAEEIRAVGLRAIARDSTHDGAHHLLGRWNYEVMRLSGLERFLAKSLLGGGFFREASWDAARAELTRAVALDPERIYHRLDLGRVLLARKEWAAAGVELRRIAELPTRVAADSTYRREAAALLAGFGDRLRPAP